MLKCVAVRSSRNELHIPDIIDDDGNNGNNGNGDDSGSADDGDDGGVVVVAVAVAAAGLGEDLPLDGVVCSCPSSREAARGGSLRSETRQLDSATDALRFF